MSKFTSKLVLWPWSLPEFTVSSTPRSLNYRSWRISSAKTDIGLDICRSLLNKLDVVKSLCAHWRFFSFWQTRSISSTRTLVPQAWRSNPVTKEREIFGSLKLQCYFRTSSAGAVDRSSDPPPHWMYAPLNDDEAAYRIGRRIFDRMLTLRTLCETASLQKIILHLAFVDLPSALDTIDHSMLWKAFSEAESIRHFISALLDGILFLVESYQVTRWSIGKPCLGKRTPPRKPRFRKFIQPFFGTVDWIRWNVWTTKVMLDSRRIFFLKFADDIIVISPSPSALTRIYIPPVRLCHKKGFSDK